MAVGVSSNPGVYAYDYERKINETSHCNPI